MKYQYLPHTADIRMLIEGGSIQELFHAGLKGMSHILNETICDTNDQFSIKTKIEVRSMDTTLLLVDFLSEVLSHSYANNCIYCDVEVRELEEQYLLAEVSGKETAYFDEEIKAVTYHEAAVKKNEQGRWETLIIFDI